jgi:two-component system, chemotaxis family, chemotaxis protein CheV
MSKTKYNIIMHSMVENTIRIDALTGLVVFTLGGNEFSADIKDISAIINPNELKEAPDLASDKPFVRINNLEIPLLDLYRSYNLRSSGSEEDKRILAVEVDNHLFGFMVDKVKEIFTMSRDLKEKLEFIPIEKEVYLAGVLKYEGRSLYLPDFKLLHKDFIESERR